MHASAESQGNNFRFQSDLGIDPDMEQKVISRLENLFGHTYRFVLEKGNKRKSKRSKLSNLNFSFKEAISLLARAGLKRTTSAFKEVPWSVRQSSKKIQAAFLRGLFEADGSAYVKCTGQVELQYCSLSEQLIKQIQVMLLNFGIFAVSRKRWNKEYQKFYSYLTISEGNSVIRFKDEINFLSDRKSSILKLYSFRPETQPFICVKDAKEFKHSLYKASSKSKYEKLILYPWSSVKSLTYDRINKILLEDSSLPEDFILTLKELRKYKADEISLIEDAGELDTVDFEMPDSHSFILNGVVSHNTTMARVYAAAVNCHNPKDGSPCLECEACKEVFSGISQDVLEMDAASKRSIDDIRELAKHLEYSTFSLKYRVVILDEVHSLTPEAWQALLKTLEEPRDNVIFIMCTTNPEKVPETILSRAISLNVSAIKEADIFEALKNISAKEGVTTDDQSLHFIASKSRGIMRDAVKDLNTAVVVFGKEFTIDQIRQIFSFTDLTTILSFIESVVSDTVDVAVSSAELLSKMFSDEEKILQMVYRTLSDILLVKLGVNKSEQYSQSELAELKRISQLATSRFLWNFLSAVIHSIENFRQDVSNLEVVVLKSKEEQFVEAKQPEQQSQAQQFNLQSELDSI